MSDEQPKRRSLRIEPSELALEIISIVIAIVLATAVSQVVDGYRTRATTHEALREACREITDGDRLLSSVQPLHLRVRHAFDAALRSAHGERLEFTQFFAAFERSAPHGFRPFNGTTTAWEVARSSNVLGNVPYAVRAALQSRYSETGVLSDLNTALLAHLEATPTDERPNFFFTAVAISLILGDIVVSEQRLIEDDSAALQALRAASLC